ncbi:MAG: hypothetical protein WC813_01180 [Patescibacteria group bacterium]|jgi:hypothetical protein
MKSRLQLIGGLIGATVLTTTFITLTFIILVDLGFFWSLMADGRMTIFPGSGGRYQYSVIRRLKCELFHPDKQYRRIGADDAWMSEVIGGYWCKSDEDIQQWNAMRG